MSLYRKSFEDLLREGTQLLHSGKVQEALPLLRSAHERQPHHLNATLNFSGALILSRKFRDAVSILEPMAESVPDNAMIWVNLGAAYLGNPVLAREEEQDQALNAFKQALQIDPQAPSVAYNIGLIYEDRQEIKRAMKWFDKAIRTNPRDVHARRKLKRLGEEMASTDNE